MAQSLGMESYIVMPKGTPKVKKDAVSDYKAKIIECG
jgi:threonine dehydratase